MNKQRTAVSRADLIDCLRLGDNRLEQIALLAGFQARKKQPAAAVKPVKPPQAERPAGDAKEASSDAPQAARPRFHCVQARRSIAGKEGRQTDEPAWFRDASPLPDDPPAEAKAVKTLPLSPWRRLWPFLRMALSEEQNSRRLDMPRLIRYIAEARMPHKIPYQQKQGWAAHCQLIIEVTPRLVLFWNDFVLLERDLRRPRGEAGLRVHWLAQGPDEFQQAAFSGEKREKLPLPGTPVLILSDLGLYDASGQSRKAWVRLGRSLRAAGLFPAALLPCARHQWHPDLSPLFYPVYWDRGQGFPRVLLHRRGPEMEGGKISNTDAKSFPRVLLHRRGPEMEGGKMSDTDAKNFPRVLLHRCGPEMEGGVEKISNADVKKLLTLLAPTIRVEPGLLRAARYLLPQADVSVEMAVWQHPDTRTCLSGFACVNVEEYRAAFRLLCLQDPAVRDRIVALLKEHHAALPLAVLSAEMEYCGVEEKEYQDYLASAVKLLAQQPDHAGMRAWVERSSRRHDRAAWDRDVFITAAWVIAHKRELAAGQIEKPAGLDLGRAAWLLADDKKKTRCFALRQRGKKLFFSPEMPGPLTEEKEEGSLLAYVNNALGVVEWGIFSENDTADLLVHRCGNPEDLAIPLPEAGILYLKTDREELWIGTMEKPEWAEAMDQDRYGLFADVNVRGVTQRMRWIAPGQFRMGSPESEAQRWSERELAHEVRLRHGFWLADTVCTQALWQAVTGENPSYFKGDKKPVERVSWEDCCDFMQKSNEEFSELALRFPTEAEWEYACRADTDTPFWFGDNITPEQVNYHGNHPYADGKKGLFRSKTVEVMALPCNAWGLYQMHGNVFEWCADWFGDYPDEPLIDPVGADSGSSRVMRGGSWANFGLLVRSAYRHRHSPDNRDMPLGFRFARGQKSPAWLAAREEAERVSQARQVLEKPEWADRVGEDHYGVFADFSIRGVVQRMRQIEPGRFMMGSPESEAKRDDDEHLHEVTLTRGFWLAETACTQALWQAIMGENPSHFKGEEKPVERVSWEDAQKFILQLNEEKPGLALKLPSEAEWEYACRAGTDTPFWFGDNITPEQVNYDGNYPYAGGKKGRYRKETVDVKALPCNSYGLYQMHGNVWEWCADWFGNYPDEPVTDPVGPDSGSHRVVRGGSWANYGQLTRSVFRLRFSPDYRNMYLGFRFARGQ